ncbi:hypothetical protein AYO45_05355 [Gammaproteobacteria bacterium SCGC AG-212-F23]|nr:hypothetical protein AYO45_05355 [Gammaproteobacteria bacterium SCGC AG-212-F23]
MRKIMMIAFVAATLLTQQVFADDMDSVESKPCGVIAKACLAAGYARTEEKSKKFWKDCMKPVILGKTVQGVTVDAATVKACQAKKVEQLQNDLQDLQKAMSSH